MNITPRNLDGYGAPEIDWARVQEVLDTQLTQAPDTGGPDRHTCWLTTINPDGSPHVTAVGVVALNGHWHFTSGPATRKSLNLARDPRCVFSVATQPFDIVIEGTAHRATDADELRAAAEAYRRAGWPAEVDGDALTAEYSAPSAGPAPWHVYRVEPATVFALGTSEPGGATKFRVTR
jgi:Pyridoxamine 5'-phosphate oxidase